MKLETKKTHRGPQGKSRNKPHAPCSVLHDERGFTLIELAVVIAIVGIISVVAVANLFGRRGQVDLDNSTRQIVAVLREAQSRSINQEDNIVWGVHFDNTTTTSGFYSLFKDTYSAANTVSRYNLPNRVRFATSSITGGSTLDITFTKISGIPSTSTSIALQLGVSANNGTAASVSRDSSGQIFFDAFGRSNL